MDVNGLNGDRLSWVTIRRAHQNGKLRELCTRVSSVGVERPKYQGQLNSDCDPPYAAKSETKVKTPLRPRVQPASALYTWISFCSADLLSMQ